MDTIAHALLGVAIGVVARHAGADGAGAAAQATGQALFWGCVVAAQVPDLDLVTMLRDRLNHIKHHHGLTHSLAGATVLAAAVAAWACWQWPGAPFAAVYPWILLAMVGGHLLPDWLTAFGTRLLLPFRGDFLALDWLAQSEPVLTAVLLAGDAMAFRDPLRGHLWAGAGLAAAVLFTAWRGYSHARIRAAIRRAYASRYHVLRVAAHPHPWQLTRYEYIVDTPGLCHLGSAWLDGRVEEHVRHERVRLTPQWDEVRQDSRVAGILRFTRNPVVQVRRLPEGGWLFGITDFRGGCAFHFTIIVDEHLRVLAARRAPLAEARPA